MVMNMHKTGQILLEAMFFNSSTSKLCKESQGVPDDGINRCKTPRVVKQENMVKSPVGPRPKTD
jgi:hypothetical protein